MSCERICANCVNWMPENDHDNESWGECMLPKTAATAEVRAYGRSSTSWVLGRLDTYNTFSCNQFSEKPTPPPDQAGVLKRLEEILRTGKGIYYCSGRWYITGHPSLYRQPYPTLVEAIMAE